MMGELLVGADKVFVGITSAKKKLLCERHFVNLYFSLLFIRWIAK